MFLLPFNPIHKSERQYVISVIFSNIHGLIPWQPIFHPGYLPTNHNLYPKVISQFSWPPHHELPLTIESIWKLSPLAVLCNSFLSQMSSSFLLYLKFPDYRFSPSFRLWFLLLSLCSSSSGFNSFITSFDWFLNSNVFPLPIRHFSLHSFTKHSPSIHHMLFSVLNIEDIEINKAYKDHLCLQGTKTSKQKCLKQCDQGGNSHTDVQRKKNIKMIYGNNAFLYWSYTHYLHTLFQLSLITMLGDVKGKIP